MSGDLLYHISSYFLDWVLSLILELGWKRGSPSDLPASAHLWQCCHLRQEITLTSEVGSVILTQVHLLVQQVV